MSSNPKPTNQQALDAKRLLHLEIIIGVAAIIVLFTLIAFAILVPMTDWQMAILIITSIAQFLAIMFCAIRLEQIVGFYHCAKCGHDYIPTYGSVLWSLHFGRTRYLKCPKCGQKSWQKKQLTKTDIA